jgi:hypothetical protein
LKNIFLLLISFSIINSSCQRKVSNYDAAIKKLVGKTWVIVKRCMNDSCYAVTDNHVYSYFPKSFKSSINTVDSTSIQFDCYDVGKNGTIKITDVFHSWIVFYSDSSTTKNNIYRMVLTWDDMRQKGNISFVSDSEFVLFRPFPEFEASNRGSNIGTKIYFKLVNTPKDILATDK